MKSTYKLLGVEWDHYPLPIYLPPLAECGNIEHFSVERNLFDLTSYKRRIDITDVLSHSGGLPYDIVEKVCNCDCIYLRLDYEPSSAAVDARSFYCLRVLQIIAFFENNLVEVPIFIEASDAMWEKCKLKYEEMKRDGSLLIHK